jgi:hypothetical protein
LADVKLITTNYNIGFAEKIFEFETIVVRHGIERLLLIISIYLLEEYREKLKLE